MSRVSLSAALSHERERLAGVSASDNIHSSTPRPAVEGLNVAPDRSFTHGRLAHPRHDSGRGVGFPLDVTHSIGSGHGESDAELEAAGSGAEGEEIDPGM